MKVNHKIGSSVSSLMLFLLIFNMTSVSASTDDAMTDDAMMELSDDVIPHVRADLPEEDLPLRRPIFVLWNWGYITEPPSDKAAYDWNGTVSIDNGTVEVVKKVLYESNDTLPEGPTDLAASVEVAAVTTVHWDGVLLKFVPETVEDNNVTFSLNGQEKVLSVKELNFTGGITDEIDGKQIMITPLSHFSHLGSVMRLRLFAHQQEIIQELREVYDYLKKLVKDGTLTSEKAGRIMHLLEKLVRLTFTDNLKDRAKEKIENLKERIKNATLDADDFESALTSLHTEMVSGDLEGKFAAGITPFCDFDDSAWFASDVDFLKQAGIASGDADKCTFRPGDAVSRAEILKMGVEASGDGSLLEQEKDPDFQDSREHWAKKYIAFALNRKLVSGFADGFHPDQAVTRAEAVKIVFNILGIKPTQNDLAMAFPDMQGHWGSAITAYAKELGIVSGDPDGNFRPDKPVNRAEAAKIIHAAIDYVQGISNATAEQPTT